MSRSKSTWARRSALAVVSALMLAGCGLVGGPGTGTVSGRVTVTTGELGGHGVPLRPLEPEGGFPASRAGSRTAGFAAGGHAARALDAYRRGELTEAGAPFVPGELVVAFGSRLAAAPRLSAAGEPLQAVRQLALDGAVVYKTAATTLREALELAAALESRPDVLYAHPNYLLFPAEAPNDPGYAAQWHFRAIGLEEAWDVTTGSADVVVAVVDSGVLYSATDPTKRHPDLVGRVLPGYDFISNPSYANDGDGRDPDPYDTVPSGGYHGTHVAGTIGAATDNGMGVAGVDWRAKLLPLRVLGSGGGSVADVADAVVWAVGGGVPGVPTNQYPADVINLSLGARSTECWPALATALAYASARAIVVAAAGNYNEPANDFVPANCEGPIVVGATDRTGSRAHYSNYGSRVDVMAPGGDVHTAEADGVYSTWANGGYGYMEGTSMAAPHVSGVVSLMKALDPALDTARALELLRASSRPLSNAQCRGSAPAGRTLYSFDCGAGIVDAHAALTYLVGTDEPEQPVHAGSITLWPAVLDLGADAESGVVTLTNVGDGPVFWALEGYFDQGVGQDNPAPVPAGAVTVEIVGDPGATAAEGTLAAGASVSLRLFVDRSMLAADGFYAIQPLFTADGEEFVYQVRFTKASTPVAQLRGPVVVVALKESAGGGFYVSGSVMLEGVLSAYELDVEAGRNLVTAWSDENRDGEVNEGDYLGVHPTWASSRWVEVPRDGFVTGVDVALQPFVGRGPAGLPAGVLEALQGLTEAGD